METAPADAFALLGNDTRMAALAAFAPCEAEKRPKTLTFTELFEATDEATTAGFAYHIRQLRGHYLRQVEDGYRLTDAGRRVVTALAARSFTDRVDREKVPVSEACPLCDGDLRATASDNVVAVGCRDCERTLCKLPFPPRGFASYDSDAELLTAVDRLYRSRVRLMRNGTCPDCGGRTDRTVAVVGESEGSNTGDEPSSGGEPGDATESRALATLSCTECGERLRCPVTVTLLDHPDVVTFHRSHDADPRARPVWNVGDAWSEQVLSTAPVCVRVSCRLGEETLALFVGSEGAVRHVEQRGADADPEDATDAAAA